LILGCAFKWLQSLAYVKSALVFLHLSIARIAVTEENKVKKAQWSLSKLTYRAAFNPVMVITKYLAPYIFIVLKEQ